MINLDIKFIEINNSINQPLKLKIYGSIGRFYNTSIVNIEGSKYLLLSRYTSIISFSIPKDKISNGHIILHDGKKIKIEGKLIPEDQGDINFFYKPIKIIPGNDIECANLNNSTNKWTLFWWNNWVHTSNQSRHLILGDYSIFIIWDSTNNTFKLTGNFLHSADIRLCKYEDKIFGYESDLTKIYQINNEGAVIRVINLSLPLNNKNLQIITINENTIKYFNWFTKDGIRVDKINCNDAKFLTGTSDLDLNMTFDCKVDISYIKLTYPIIGTGSCLNDKNQDVAKKNYGIMPLFSFTTPHILIDTNKYLGVGHIKIYQDTHFEYIKESNIDVFRRCLIEDMKKYDQRYIPHYGTSQKTKCEGYIYLMYFYIYTCDEKTSDFKISSSFIPIDLSSEYIFSLVFPMGIAYTPDKKSIYVTAGIGDYYSVILTFNLEQIIKLCTYSLLNIDMSKYQYYLGIVDKTNIHLVKRLSDYKKLNKVIGGNDANYYNKYIKYKEDYLIQKYKSTKVQNII